MELTEQNTSKSRQVYIFNENWDFKDSNNTCECEDRRRTMNHNIEKCSINTYAGGLPCIHKL